MFTPDGKIYLIGGIPLDNTYVNQIDFDNENQQLNYFLDRTVHSLNEYTFVRKDGSVKVDLNFEQLFTVNYLLYRNYSAGKWIYAFITDKKYLSEGVTELIIETDVFQTYLFDFELKHSFIEREHQDRWSGPGSPIFNLNDEGLTLGDEYIKESETKVAEFTKHFLVVATQPLEENSNYPFPYPIQVYPTPFYYYIIEWGATTDAFCAMLANRPEVIAITMIPFFMGSDTGYTETVQINYEVNENPYTITAKRVLEGGSSTGKHDIGSFNKYKDYPLPTSFGTRRTRNWRYESKLLVYPYNYNMLTDNMAKPLILKNEYLSGSSPTVRVVQTFSHQPKTKYYIGSGYKGENDGKNFNVINDQVNDAPLITDHYLNYMMQHKASIQNGMAVNIGTTAATIGLGLATGGLGLIAGAGMAMNSISKISQEMAKQKDLQNTPDSVRHNGNNLSFDIIDGNTSIKVYRFAVHDKIKKILGDYWAMYGYKALEVKQPDLRSRYYYNYIKTVGANISGNMDNKDIDKLKGIFDEGVTIWHIRSGVTPLSYQYDNVEMNLI